MAYRDLLLQLTGYPEPTPSAAIEQAVSLAAKLGARLTALTFEIELHVPANPFARALLDLPGMVAAERDKSILNARELAAAVERLAGRHGVSASTVIERSAAGNVPNAVTEHARLHDLTIVAVDAAGAYQQYVAESVIFGSGRPVLLVPAAPKGPAEVGLDAIGIAWDASRPAARAVADALPLLGRAKTVRVVTVENEKPLGPRRSAADLARHLACHGVEAIVETESAEGRPIGEVLQAYAGSRGLDLLVMGAYGHSRMRDFVLGGATKSIVAAPPMPVFLSH